MKIRRSVMIITMTRMQLEFACSLTAAIKHFGFADELEPFRRIIGRL